MILTLTPIFEACARPGYLPEGEAIHIGGWPVQFLHATQPLVIKAEREAEAREAGGLTTRVMGAGHLMAIALHTGRAKDHARLIMFMEAGVVNMEYLKDILSRHSLIEAWVKIDNRFLTP